MSVNVNVVMVGGNLTRDPDLKYTPSGMAVSEFTVAVNRKVKRSGQEEREETIFVDVTAFAKLAEVCAEFLKKGRPVLVEARLAQDRWEDQKTGQARSKLYAIAEHVNFLSPASKDAKDASAKGAAPEHADSSAPAKPS